MGSCCRLCLGSRLHIAILLNYAYKHVRKFVSKRFFGFFWTTSFTHDDFNLPPEGDQVLLSFLRRTLEENLLDQTVLVVMSDHGGRMNGFRSTFQGHLEETLPLLAFVFPPWFRRKYANAVKNLVDNASKLTTHFDLHETLLDFTNLTRLDKGELDRRSSTVDGRRSQSLFLPAFGNRTCSQLGIPDNYCACQYDVRQVNVTDPTVRNAAMELENCLNKYLEGHAECAKLKVKSVENANLKMAMKGTGGSNSSDTEWYNDLVIIVATQPGTGLFEGTVRYSNTTNSYTVIGQISRINTYRGESLCIEDKILKLYCYCQ